VGFLAWLILVGKRILFALNLVVTTSSAKEREEGSGGYSQPYT